MDFSKVMRFVEKHMFALIVTSYFVIMAGVVYDLINEPPGFGQTVDQRGHVRPETIMKGRSNGQYVVEGVCASMFFVIAALGMVLVERSIRMSDTETKKPIMAVGGVCISAVGMLMTVMFSRTKFN